MMIRKQELTLMMIRKQELTLMMIHKPGTHSNDDTQTGTHSNNDTQEEMHKIIHKPLPLTPIPSKLLFTLLVPARVHCVCAI